jgi:flavin reductase (DIM6/NTAB) family NADH-FMN oxidoreductase RutF
MSSAIASDAMHYYEPMQGHGLAHDPLTAIVGPRPIGWISSHDRQGRLNLAPYSFFNVFSYRPPILGFASSGWKDTVRNVEATGEFVWNLVTRPLAEAMNQTSASVPPEVDEFALAGLTPVPCRQVAVPRVGESPVAMECKLVQIVRLHRADGTPMDNWLSLGEVVGVHIDKALLRDGVYQTAAARPVLRAGRLTDYAEIIPEIMFEMMRPA